VLLGSNIFSGKNSKLFSAIFVKNLLILTFIFIIRMFCKYFIFSGVINIFITIIIMSFLSMIILSLNYNNKNNNLNPYLFKIIYIPLIFIIFINSGITLDVFIISFCIFINIYFNFSFLFSTGNPGSSLPGSSQGSGGVGGSGGNNNGSSLVSLIPNDEPVHSNRRFVSLKYNKINERYNTVVQYYNNTGTKREFLDAFIISYNKLYADPHSLNYNDLAVLKKGYVDYNHLLSPNVKLSLHGLAKPGDLKRETGYGLQTSTLINNRRSISVDTHSIILQIQQEI
jgi:hypothetical protein